MKTEISMMNSHVRVLDALKIEIGPRDIAQCAETRTNTKRLGEMAADVLRRVQGDWRPRAIIRWLAVEQECDGVVVLKYVEDGVAGGQAVRLNLGGSGRFMESAQYGLAGVFTAGDELEKLAIEASEDKRYLEAYILDRIGLAVLAKTGRQINRVVERKAAAMNWGIGPLLGPGAVHGWELEDQANFCNVFPLKKIGVKVEENGVLTPLKTLSSLVGIGPGFPEKTVGSPCGVCSCKEQCQMRRDKNTLL